MRWRFVGSFLITMLGASVVAADVVGPTPGFREPGETSDFELERRWIVAAGWAVPDDQGYTSYWSWGPSVAVGIDFPIARTSSVGPVIEYTRFPVGGIPYATIDGDEWSALSVGLEARGRLRVTPLPPDLRPMLVLGLASTFHEFGTVTVHESFGDRVEPERHEDGLTITLGFGAEYAPKDRTGFFADFRFAWYSSDQTYTWQPVRIGVLFR